jgi:putative sigma-54 modulation protein
MVAMTVDDAIAEMELLNHSFYLFRNVGTGSYSVVYRREDGDYGLIDPIEA